VVGSPVGNSHTHSIILFSLFTISLKKKKRKEKKRKEKKQCLTPPLQLARPMPNHPSTLHSMLGLTRLTKNKQASSQVCCFPFLSSFSHLTGKKHSTKTYFHSSYSSVLFQTKRLQLRSARKEPPWTVPLLRP
jgi:hypothetical protein